MNTIFSANVSLEETAYVSVPSDSWPSGNFFEEFFVGDSVNNLDDYSFYLYKSKNEPIKDFMPGGASAFVVTKKVRDSFVSSRIRGCEFVPIKVNGINSDLYVLNVTNVLNVVDQKSSKIVWDTDDKSKILVFRNPVFQIAPEGDSFFKVPEDLGRIFVGKKIVDLVCREKFSGVYFEDPSEEQFGIKKPLFGSPF